MLFEGPPDVPLEQGTYAISVTDGGVMEVFIVPIAGDAAKRTYQAIFA